MSLERVRPYLEEALSLGVKEYYFTGGEPFLNPELEAILEETLRQGPATVLTNGLMLDPDRCSRLRRLADGSRYSLDFRVSLDGYDSATNDEIRGVGSFDRILRGIGNLVRSGLNPVITVTEACREIATDAGRRRFFRLLETIGIDRPRLKVLPLFRLGAEVGRGGAYDSWQKLIDGDTPAEGWDHLQCSASRMVTARGVWVCPILVNHAEARVGQTLSDSLAPFALSHQACWTCHVQGASCRT